MTQTKGYILGQSDRAARRLEIQDAHFADASERLLDDLALRPNDRVVELGCGPAVSVDESSGGSARAACWWGWTPARDCWRRRSSLAGAGPAPFVPLLADLSQPGPWLEGADVVVGRTVLHHVPMAEYVLGRLRAALRPNTRVGFIEPDFRTPLGRLGYLEATGRPELAPLHVWAFTITQLYQANRISPDVGANLGRTLESAGYRLVRSEWAECRSDEMMIENMVMFYDEVRDRLQELGVLTAAEIDQQQRLLRVARRGLAGRLGQLSRCLRSLTAGPGGLSFWSAAFQRRFLWQRPARERKR